MAIFHVATNTPPKIDLIGRWLPKQPWGPDADGEATIAGGFHLDDPGGEIGMQVFVVAAGGAWFQVPLTYHAAPMPDGDDALIGEMEHSVLGARYVYDGLRDERFVTVLAGVALSGYGQALGFAEHEGRWHVVPDEIVVVGHEPVGRRLAVDQLTAEDTGDATVLTNDQVELTVFRRLLERPAPRHGLSAAWEGHPTTVPLVTARVV